MARRLVRRSTPSSPRSVRKWTSDLAGKAEHACLNAWPSLHNVVHDDWIIRFCEGLTRRANSVNPLRASARADGASIQLFENLFRLRSCR